MTIGMEKDDPGFRFTVPTPGTQHSLGPCDHCGGYRLTAIAIVQPGQEVAWICQPCLMGITDFIIGVP